jgi:hypothetical protein
VRAQRRVGYEGAARFSSPACVALAASLAGDSCVLPHCGGAWDLLLGAAAQRQRQRQRQRQWQRRAAAAAQTRAQTLLASSLPCPRRTAMYIRLRMPCGRGASREQRVVDEFLVLGPLRRKVYAGYVCSVDAIVA